MSAVTVICRDCCYQVGGVVAGDVVRWVVCEKCRAPTPTRGASKGRTMRERIQTMLLCEVAATGFYAASLWFGAQSHTALRIASLLFAFKYLLLGIAVMLDRPTPPTPGGSDG